MLVSSCTVCDKKKSMLMENKEVIGLLSKLGIKTPLRFIPSIDEYLF